MPLPVSPEKHGDSVSDRVVHAVALLSGGLDSQVAVKMILEQGVSVTAIKFTSPFCTCDSGGSCHSAVAAKEFGIPLTTIPKGDAYLDIVRSPKFGYGRAMNPCIDCRIFILRKAKEYADATGAAFVFTGEVLGQRPMSQHRKALDIIEEESGLKGKLLRPLSAKLLAPTDVEMQGIIDRGRLGAIQGRSREGQITYADNHGIAEYPCSAGGCLLTDAAFARRLKDLFDHQPAIIMRDVLMLKVGRHFRYRGAKIIIGRNRMQNEHLATMRSKDEVVLFTENVPGPSALVTGDIDSEVLSFGARATAAYADASQGNVSIRAEGALSSWMIEVQPDIRQSVSAWKL